MTGRDASRQEEKHHMCVTWFKCSCQVKGVFVDGEGLKKNYKRICISEVQINVQVSLNASSQLLTEVFYLPFPYTVLFLTHQPIMKHL